MRAILAILLAAVAVLAACAGPQDAGGPPAPPTSPAAPGDGRFPVTIPTAFGEVTVPQQPRRVVALGWSDAETALALGVPPVGASDWLAVGGDGLGPWVTQRYPQGGSPRLIGTLQPDLEAITALAPDLILDTRASGTPERHDQLARLGVPVVSIPPGAQDYLTPWRDQVRMVGAALGRTTEAATLQADLERRFTAARAANPAFTGASIVVGARTTTGDYAAYVGRSSRLEFMRELGFVNSPTIESRTTGGGFTIPISRERLDLLDARVTVMQAISNQAADITNDPLFATVPSVRAGRGIVLGDQDLSLAFASASAPGWAYALDRITPQLAAAVAKP